MSGRLLYHSLLSRLTAAATLLLLLLALARTGPARGRMDALRVPGR
jgi:hypothetical protein